MSVEDMSRLSKPDVDFRTYLTAVSSKLFRTPDELYALPIGTILAGGKFGKIPCYYCIYSESLGMMTVCLDTPRKTPAKDELIIKWRGVPKTIEYQSSYNHRKVTFDPNFEVTLLGLSLRGKSHRLDGSWALIDHT